MLPLCLRDDLDLWTLTQIQIPEWSMPLTRVGGNQPAVFTIEGVKNLRMRSGSVTSSMTRSFPPQNGAVRDSVIAVVWWFWAFLSVG